MVKHGVVGAAMGLALLLVDARPAAACSCAGYAEFEAVSGEASNPWATSSWQLVRAASRS